MADSDITNRPGDPPMIARQLLAEGISTAESGQRERARTLFHRAAALDPKLAPAWLWLGGLTPDPREALGYLERAREIDPNDPAITDGILWCTRRIATLPAPAEPAPAKGAALSPAQSSRVASLVVPRELTPIPAQAQEPVGVATAPPKSRSRLRPVLTGLAILLAAAVLWAAGAQIYRGVSGGPAPAATATQTYQEIIDGLQPQLDEAWRAGRWTVAISILERIRGLDPSYGGVDDWLATAYTGLGRDMAMEGRWEQAFVAFDAALAAKPGHAGAKGQQEAARRYLSGRQKFDAADWEGAASDLQTVFKLDRAYRDVEKSLYLAYWRLGGALQTAGDLGGAKGAYEAALGVKPDSEEAADKLSEVNLILFPPTPTPTPRPPKRIVVDISEQHFYAYEGSTLVFSWVCSTGEAGRDTKAGEFYVQSKIPEAYSNIWKLRMPYWLGIYWAGSTENGIHALPINPNGQTLWAGFLGRKVSFGCVILDTASAKRLYDWAEIGTPVSIRY